MKTGLLKLAGIVCLAFAVAVGGFFVVELLKDNENLNRSGRELVSDDKSSEAVKLPAPSVLPAEKGAERLPVNEKTIADAEPAEAEPFDDEEFDRMIDEMFDDDEFANDTEPDAVLTETSISGTVLDKLTMIPFSGVEVTARRSERNFRGRAQRNTEENDETPVNQYVAFTDEDGQFTFDFIQPGTYNVEAKFAEYIPVRTRVRVSENNKVNNVELLLAKGGQIKGKVVDTDSIPLQDKWIMVVSEEIIDSADGTFRPIGDNNRLLMMRAMDSRVMTDENGSYLADNLEQGKYRLFVLLSSSGAGAGRTNFESPDAVAEVFVNNTTICDIVIGGENNPKVKVSGSVLKNTTPVAGKRINFALVRGRGGFADTQSTVDGEYSVLLNSGRYNYIVDRVSLGIVDVPDEKTFKFDIIIPAFFVSGVVLKSDNKSPVEDARIVLMKNESRMETGPVRGFGMVAGRGNTDDKGEFKIDNLETGNYVLQVVQDGYGISAENIRVANNNLEKVTVIMSSGGVIKGTVRDLDGEPVGGAYFEIKKLGNEASISFDRGSRGAVSQNDGSYSLPSLADGTYNLIVSRRGYASVSANVSAREGGETVHDFVLVSGGELKLTVLGAEDEPVAGVTVVLVHKDSGVVITSWGGGPRSQANTTNQQGIYNRNNLSAGSWSGRIAKEGYKEVRFDFKINDGTVTTMSLSMQPENK